MMYNTSVIGNMTYSKELSMKTFFTTIFSFFLMVVVIAVLFTGVYAQKVAPKEILNYTYSNNVLHFKLKNSDSEYSLLLPEDASFTSNDKLSIVIQKKTAPHQEDIYDKIWLMKYGIKQRYSTVTETVIRLYVNDQLKYDTSNHIVLKEKYTDYSGSVREAIYQ